MSTIGASFSREFFAVLTASLVAGLLILAPVAEAEEETHLFSASQSLTGGCATTAGDSVPDPGTCPGVPGLDHPSEPFELPRGIAVDAYGNRYIVNQGPTGQPVPPAGSVDIFGPDGKFITELSDLQSPYAIAVDAQGILYLTETAGLIRFDPTQFHPADGKIAYGEPPTTIASAVVNTFSALAINPENQHLFHASWTQITEYGSASEGNPELEEFLKSSTAYHEHLAVDAAHGRLYVFDGYAGPGKSDLIRVLDLDSPHNVLATFDGSTTPAGVLLGGRESDLGVDESTGNFYYAETAAGRRIYQFTADGSYVNTIKLPSGTYQAMRVDNGASSPNRGAIYISAGEGSGDKVLAYLPKPAASPPLISSVSVTGVTETEAVLNAEVNPKGKATDYRFEYTTQADVGFTSALIAGQGTLKASAEAQPVASGLTDLESGTAYRFRLIAENLDGEVEEEASFATYALPDSSTSCPNQALRTGASADLPDCRAYELVTPSDTNGRTPKTIDSPGDVFAVPQVSPQGDAVSFETEGGVIPGYDGTGSYNGDPYMASRGSEGWSTRATGPSGTEARELNAGSPSADQLYSFWSGNGGVGGAGKRLHYPDGHSEMIGEGSLGTTPNTRGLLISPAAQHVIFCTVGGLEQLEPEAPPTGTQAIYDRSPGGPTHVVSLLPGNATPAPGQHAAFVGASPDGRGVAFQLTGAASSVCASASGPIYLRHDNTDTYLAAPAGAAFAGLSEGGERLFYVEAGDLYAFDVQSESAIQFTESGDVTVVNVAAGGTAAYFVSPSVLTAAADPNGEVAQAGAQNLYLSREGATSFVGTVTELDVKGKVIPGYGAEKGLGLWVGNTGSPGNSTSRSTSDGSVLLFESRAVLDGVDPQGTPQVYRFDAEASTLRCLSCNRTGAALGEGAGLESLEIGGGPLSNRVSVANLRGDGSRAFFESTEALVAADTDGLRDVYEWEEEGLGSCRTSGGCVYLISSPSSGEDEYLYGASESGDDVFVWTPDLLLPALDPDGTASIYDARVNGGIAGPPPPAGECLGEACQPTVSPPNDPTPASSVFQGAGNPADTPKAKRCPKGKRPVRRAGKVRCVPRKSTKKAHGRGQGRNADTKRGAGR